MELGACKQQTSRPPSYPPPRMQTPIQAVPNPKWASSRRTCPPPAPAPTAWPTTGSCQSPFLIALPPLWDTTRSQASLTVMKTLPREEVASKEGPGLHCSPKAAAPKLSLHSALTGDTPIQPPGVWQELSPSAHPPVPPTGSRAPCECHAGTPRACMVGSGKGSPCADQGCSPRDDLAHRGQRHSRETSGCRMGAVAGIQWVQAGDAAQHPARHRTAPKTQVATMPSLRTPGTRQVNAFSAKFKINH